MRKLAIIVAAFAVVAIAAPAVQAQSGDDDVLVNDQIRERVWLHPGYHTKPGPVIPPLPGPFPIQPVNPDTVRSGSGAAFVAADQKISQSRAPEFDAGKAGGSSVFDMRGGGSSAVSRDQQVRIELRRLIRRLG